MNGLNRALSSCHVIPMITHQQVIFQSGLLGSSGSILALTSVYTIGQGYVTDYHSNIQLEEGESYKLTLKNETCLQLRLL